jgi:hypothetical protein
LLKNEIIVQNNGSLQYLKDRRQDLRHTMNVDRTCMKRKGSKALIRSFNDDGRSGWLFYAGSPGPSPSIGSACFISLRAFVCHAWPRCNPFAADIITQKNA